MPTTCRPAFGLRGGSLPEGYKPSKTWIVGPETSLIQGDGLAGWTTLGGKNPPEAWSVENGVLHLKGKGGDIMSEREYENFILDFSWTIAKGGNSGIKYRLKRFEGKGWLGPEYQVLDDYNTKEGLKPKNNTSSLYDILPADASRKHLYPNDQMNHGRIVVLDNKLEHWINGKKVVDMEIGSRRWNELVAESKFANVIGYGLNESGRIMVQDHQCEVWFHGISIRELIETNEANASYSAAADAGEPTSQCRNIQCCQPLRRNASGGSCGVVNATSCCVSNYGSNCKPVSCRPMRYLPRNIRCCR